MNIFDEILKQQHRAEARANSLADEILAALQAARADLTAQLSSLRVRFLTAATWQEESLARRKTFLEAQKREVERLVGEIFISMRSDAFSAALDTMSHVTAQTARFGGSSNIVFGPGSPRLDLATVTAWAESTTVDGLTMTEWLSGMADSSARRIVRAGRQAMIEGMTVQKTAQLLRREIEGSRPQVEAVARTFLLSASNYARERAVESIAGNLDFQWQYVATLDDRTCLVCGPDDLKVFKRDEPRPSLPRHTNCRCVYVPKTATWRQLGAKADDLDLPERAATRHDSRTVHHRDGSTSTEFTVSEVEHTTESYSEWITRQAQDDPGFAREVLGKTRFELLKAGKITLDKMRVDGRIKNLAELKT